MPVELVDVVRLRGVKCPVSAGPGGFRIKDPGGFKWYFGAEIELLISELGDLQAASIILLHYYRNHDVQLHGM